MLDTIEPVTYQSYLLRCWLVSAAAGERPARWRFVLRDVAAEPVERDFATLAELFAFLSDKTGENSGTDAGGST
jgi:hypothetical protein